MGYVSSLEGRSGEPMSLYPMGFFRQVSHALALHRGIVAVPSGTTKIETRENPFTQVEGRSDGKSGIC